MALSVLLQELSRGLSSTEQPETSTGELCTSGSTTMTIQMVWMMQPSSRTFSQKTRVNLPFWPRLDLLAIGQHHMSRIIGTTFAGSTALISRPSMSRLSRTFGSSRTRVSSLLRHITRCVRQSNSSLPIAACKRMKLCSTRRRPT